MLTNSGEPEYEELWADEPSEFEWDGYYQNVSIPRTIVQKKNYH